MEMKSRQLFCCFAILSFLTNLASAENPVTGFKLPAVFSVCYLGDIAGYYHGGLSSDVTYLGLLDFSMDIQTGSTGLWQGGGLFLDIQSTRGVMSRNGFEGEHQVFDNIENGDFTYLYQLWYRQQVGHFWILGGLHDLNSEFLNGGYSSEFVNSSFGIMPVVSLNMPVSIFPKTALALVTGYSNDRYTAKFGIYDGNPGSLQDDPNNLNISLKLNQGMLCIAEFAFENSFSGGRKGMIKGGASLFTGNQICQYDSSIILKRNYNVYLLAEQEIFHEAVDNQQGLGLLLQVGAAPSAGNMNSLFLGVGINYTGLLPRRDADIFGAALAFASMRNSYDPCAAYSMGPSETVVEISYKTHIFKHLYVQPNFQYFVNPGNDHRAGNVCFGLIRFGINY
jgi:porin